MDDMIERMEELDTKLGHIRVTQNRKKDRELIQNTITNSQLHLRDLITIMVETKRKAESAIINAEFSLDLVKKEIEKKEKM